MGKPEGELLRAGEQTGRRRACPTAAYTYRIDYWIAYKATPTRYPVVYTHKRWKVVRVVDTP